jgi:hypothetical protein
MLYMWWVALTIIRRNPNPNLILLGLTVTEVLLALGFCGFSLW